MNYLSFVLALMLSGAAWAAENAPAGNAPMEDATPAEKAAAETPQFMAVDKDSSGGISMEEAVAVPGLTAAFSVVDRNSDKEINKEEYADVSSGKLPLSPTTGSQGTSGAQETIQ